MSYQIKLRQDSGKKIYVDPQGIEGFYLYSGEIRKIGLKEDMILEEEDLTAIREQYAVPRAKKRALGLLAKKDMTRQELVDKLESSRNDSYSIAVAMEFVTRNGYIDDENYARDYLYFRKHRKSFRQIQEELIRKGISREILQRIMEEEGDQEEKDIRPLVEKYARKFPELDYVASQKICMHFGRKGYSLETIRRIIEEMKAEIV